MKKIIYIVSAISLLLITALTAYALPQREAIGNRTTATFTFDGVYRDIKHCSNEDYQNKTCMTVLNQDEENMEYFNSLTGGKSYAILDGYTGKMEDEITNGNINLLLSRKNLHFFVDKNGKGSGSGYMLIKNNGKTPITLKDVYNYDGQNIIHAVNISNSFQSFNYGTGNEYGSPNLTFMGDTSYQIAFKLFGKQIEDGISLKAFEINPGQTLAIRYDYKVKPFKTGTFNIWAGNSEAREVSGQNQAVPPTLNISFSIYEK